MENQRHRIKLPTARNEATKQARELEAKEKVTTQLLATTIGYLETPLDTKRATIRTREAAFGNFVADAILAAVRSDVAIITVGTIRADRDFNAGTFFTIGDLLRALPFQNKSFAVRNKWRRS